MNRDHRVQNARQAGAARACAGITLLAAGLLQCGCVDWTYDRVALGQVLHEYARVFPEERTRRTTSTLCYLGHSPAGRTDAVVLLLTRDRRVAAKMQASHTERKWGPRTQTAYALRGELDPSLAQLDATGPADALRAVADELTSVEGDKFTRDAHGWVAAGLVRLLQRWPHLGDEGPAPPRLIDILDHVPGSGVARITVDQRGAYILEYTQAIAR